MKYQTLKPFTQEVSALGLGTWVMGGWMWGGAEDLQSERAIETAIANGVNFIDTAPVYGFGRSEEIVGRTLQRLNIRDRVLVATKCGLEWDEKQQVIRRNSSPERILKEVDQSRKRLQTDVIDLYQVHWPDESVPFETTMEVLDKLLHRGTIRAIGVSNFTPDQMKRCLHVTPLHTAQPPYNLFEREIESDLLPFCRKWNISVIAYGALCRGLLSGKFSEDTKFPETDVRFKDPKFQKENFSQYLKAVHRLKEVAQSKQMTVGQLAIQWVASQPGVHIALAGARTSRQALENGNAFNSALTEKDMKQIDRVLAEEISVPVSPAFMGPPRKKATT